MPAEGFLLAGGTAKHGPQQGGEAGGLVQRHATGRQGQQQLVQAKCFGHAHAEAVLAQALQQLVEVRRPAAAQPLSH
jgi:hypothetical protein